MKRCERAIVLGLGGSGEAAAQLLRSEGSRVTVVDGGASPQLQKRAEELRKNGIKVSLGVTTLPFADPDLCVVSPGVPAASPWVRELAARGVPVISELELGWSRRKCRVVAITGSNGKSTAVKWFAESLRAAGLKAVPAGNYGPPVCRVVLENPALDWLVLEVSTFQMETVAEFRAEVGILLNVNANHLDRHGDMRTYEALKARLFARSLPSDTCLVHEPFLAEAKQLSGGAGCWLSFGLGANSDYRYAPGRVTRRGSAVLDLSGTMFDNDVLGQAGAAIAGGLEACRVAPNCARTAALSFVPLPHRMQPVGEKGGVRFINDSKATNLAAMAAALRVVPSKVRLIAGGLAKEHDFGIVKELLAKKAGGVYLIGKASKEMYSAWSDVVPCRLCETLDVAVRQAGAEAVPGDTVLLSPACASFDQFRNFEERGERFAALAADFAGSALEHHRRGEKCAAS